MSTAQENGSGWPMGPQKWSGFLYLRVNCNVERERSGEMEETKARIRGFLDRYFRNGNLRNDQDFFAAGFANSLFAMQLVMFVEKEFDVKVEDDDLDIDNFNTVDAICGFIERKNGSRSHLSTIL